jgi:hypothetical protein
MSAKGGWAGSGHAADREHGENAGAYRGISVLLT